MDFIARHPEPPQRSRTSNPVAPSPSVSSGSPADTSSLLKLETLAEQILHEIKRSHEQPQHDFSVTKLLGGVMQMLSIAVMIYAYFDAENRQLMLLVSIAMQTLTISLLIMGRQK